MNDVVAHGDVVLPPGPGVPKVLQGAVAITCRREALRLLRQRYGPDFTVRLPIFGRTVVVSDPQHVRQVLKAAPAELDTVEQNLGRVMGPNSLFALRGDQHRQQRKLLTPSFNGRRLRAYEDLIEQEAWREFATWPHNSEFATMPSMMRITLNVILRAVFGADGVQLERLRQLVPRLVELGSMLALVPVPQWDFGSLSPWGRFHRYRRTYDDIVGELVDAALADERLTERDDVLALMVQSLYDDGSTMTREAIADQLVTLLSAGHETTATTLAWAIERLRRHPQVLDRLVDEIDSGKQDYLDATLTEVQRSRPVIDSAFRSVVPSSYDLGDWVLPRGQLILVGIGLVHDDAAVYERPEAFDPDRFTDDRPDTSLWLPFGGGVRRCIGAAFASLEMKVVLRTLLRGFTLEPTTDRGERWHSRGVALAPARGARAVVRPRADAGQVLDVATALPATRC
jgi:cytochrome P450